MKLIEAFSFILFEQNENIIEYQRENLVISLFPSKRRIMFAALDKAKPSHKMRAIMNQIKDKFIAKSVKKLGKDLFELVLDPSVNFLTVHNYINQIITK